MDLAHPTLVRRLPALLAIPLFLLALAFPAVVSPRASAEVRMVAKVAPEAPAVQVTARTHPAAKRVLFFVDGHKKGVKDSVDWRNGRRGVLKVERLRPGRHRVAAVAIHRGGKVSRASRIIHLARKPRRRSTSIGLEQAKRLSKTTETRPQSGVLFNGGFDDGFSGWHVQALSPRVSLFDQGAFSGSAAHFEVHDGDIEPETGSERAEVSGATFEEGQELYVRDTIRVPSSSDSDTDWQLIMQLREHDWCCSPGMAVFLDDDRELRVGAGDSTPMFWRGPELQPDRWYDLVFRVKLSQDSSLGFVEVWLDGTQQQMLNGAARIYGQTIQQPRNYIKAGIYRSPSSTGTTVVEHDNVIVGTSYEAVMSAG